MIKKENPGVSVTEIAKIAGSKWGTMNEDTKKKYEEMNKELKEKYTHCKPGSNTFVSVKKVEDKKVKSRKLFAPGV